jgi:uncharacterized lipoprotein YbaY
LFFLNLSSKMSIAMQALKARVKGGRLVLDEPSNLPDGAEVRVALVDGDDLDAEERAMLQRELEASIAEADAGETEDFALVLAELRKQL